MDDGWSMDGWWKSKIGSMNWIDYVMVCARLDYFWFLIENKSQKKNFQRKTMQKTKQKKVVAKMIKRKLTKYPINQSIGLEISGFIIKHKTKRNKWNKRKKPICKWCAKNGWSSSLSSIDWLWKIN